MKSEITSISKPKWANAEHTMIDCEITISQFGSEVLPFTASLLLSEQANLGYLAGNHFDSGAHCRECQHNHYYCP